MIVNDFTYIREFVEMQDGVSYALKYGRIFKEYLHAFYMDAKENSPLYTPAAEKFWREMLKKEGFEASESLIKKLSSDKQAPFTLHGLVMNQTIQEGYTGGNKEIDELCKDIFGVLR